VNPQLFSNMPESIDYLGFRKGGKIDPQRVKDFLNFSKKDLASATALKVSSIRFDEKMPRELLDRVKEIAHVCLLVADFFKGNAEKTSLWFNALNPQLGDMSPRDMIRVGRYKELMKFILAAREGYNE
jgi:hypothetical protein